VTRRRAPRAASLAVALAIASALAAGAATLVAACSVMNGLHLPEPEAGAPPPPPPEVEAGPSADAGADADPCDHALPPGPPSSAFGGEEKDILVAIRTFAMTVDAGAPSIGYDLDGLCTCRPQAESCRTTTKHCDDANGRDNVLAELVADLKEIQGYDLEAELNRRAGEGSDGILIRVQRYNGLPDDSDVVVSIYGSAGTGTSDGDGGVTYQPPTFTKADTWTVDENDLLGPPDALFSRSTGNGYVAGGTVVVRLDAHVRLLDGAYTTFKGAELVAQIEDTADGPTITRGTFTGRWPTSELLGSLSLVQDPKTGTPFCELSGFDVLAKGFVCPSADIALDPAVDRTSAPCDAVSAAMAFESAPASFGPFTTSDGGQARCQDAGTLRCDD
jgi:hypothetical protein